MGAIEISEVIEIAPGVNARILINEYRQLELAVLIDEDMTGLRLKNEWRYIEQLRDYIQEKQGIDPKTRKNFALLIAAELQERGLSYAEIAMYFNRDILVRLHERKLLQDAGNEERAKFCEEFCYAMLEAMRVSYPEARDMVATMSECILDGSWIWELDDYPLDRYAVVNTLGKPDIKDKIKKGNLPAKIKPYQYLLNHITDYPTYCLAYLEVIKFLKRCKRDGGLARLNKALLRHKGA